jgi:hypothetical protein
MARHLGREVLGTDSFSYDSQAHRVAHVYDSSDHRC